MLPGLPAAIGLCAGIAASLLLSKVVQQWAETGLASPVVCTGVSPILGAVAFVAALLPAFRAASIDRAQALRGEQESLQTDKQTTRFRSPPRHYIILLSRSCLLCLSGCQKMFGVIDPQRRIWHH